MTGDSLHYRVPPPPGRWPSITLAVLMHLVLFGFLWAGINWVSQKPETMDAEVWSAQDLEKAPPPPPAPEPEPVVKETPPPVEKAPVEDPEIKLEQIRKEKRLEQARVDQEKRDQEIAKKKEAAQEQAKRDDEKKQADEDKKKALADARKQQAADDKLRASTAAAERKRIAGDVDSTSTAGNSSKSQGNPGNAGWVARVTAKVKSNILGVAIPPDAANDPAEFVVGLLPDGSVAGIRQTKKSGIPAFDDAVRRAIEASQPYPADNSGKVPSSFISTNRPRDQQP